MGSAVSVARAIAYDASRALELLRAGTQISGATFREGQEEAIKSIAEGSSRLLIVQRTGWGNEEVLAGVGVN